MMFAIDLLTIGFTVGRVNLVTNPDGLVSNWCGAAFVAKAWFAFN
jgi:hypothetical protein